MKLKNSTKSLMVLCGLVASASALAGGGYTPPVSVPEPATAALLGMGVAALALRRRRNKQNEE